MDALLGLLLSPAGLLVVGIVGFFVYLIKRDTPEARAEDYRKEKEATEKWLKAHEEQRQKALDEQRRKELE